MPVSYFRQESGGRKPVADFYSLKYTRAILDGIHSGELAKVEYETYETFNLHVPKTCPNVPDELLNPAKSWTGTADFKEEVTKLGKLFIENFEKYSSEATPEVAKAGMYFEPQIYRPIANKNHQALKFEVATTPYRLILPLFLCLRVASIE